MLFGFADSLDLCEECDAASWEVNRGRVQAKTTDATRPKARDFIDSNSEFGAAYVIMNGLATVVACYGLFENSAAVVIGAMIIAMLLGPIAGVSLALVGRNNTRSARPS